MNKLVVKSNSFSTEGSQRRILIMDLIYVIRIVRPGIYYFPGTFCTAS